MRWLICAIMMILNGFIITSNTLAEKVDMKGDMKVSDNQAQNHTIEGGFEPHYLFILS